MYHAEGIRETSYMPVGKSGSRCFCRVRQERMSSVRVNPSAIRLLRLAAWEADINMALDRAAAALEKLSASNPRTFEVAIVSEERVPHAKLAIANHVMICTGVCIVFFLEHQDHNKIRTGAKRKNRVFKK